MPFDKTKYQREYMRRYRDTMRQYYAHADQIDLWTTTWLRSSIIGLIREKYHMSDDALHRLVDAVNDLVKSECPYNEPMTWERMIDVHLLYYYRTDLLSRILAGVEHPSLVPDLAKRIKELEQEMDKEVKEE